jgi:hypothetical protein
MARSRYHSSELNYLFGVRPRGAVSAAAAAAATNTTRTTTTYP